MFLDHVGVPVLVLSLVAPVSASTYIVDDNGGPGVHFTDIPPAIAFAQPGDVLLVAPGSYSAFVLDKGLVIVGHGGPTVLGPIEVRNVPAGPRAAVVDFQTTRFVVDNCAAPVVLQELRTIETAVVADSPDVRIARTQFLTMGIPADGQDALMLTNARLEFVDGRVLGHNGIPSGVPFGSGGDGAAGIRQQNARFVGAKFSAEGGRGASESTMGTHCGSGGPGLLMSAGSTAVFLGPDSNVGGGGGGWNSYYVDCYYDGCNGWAVVGDNTVTLTTSGTFLEPWSCDSGLHCIHQTGAAVANVSLIEPSPAQPSLEVSSPPIPGGTLTFTVRGEPGAQVTLQIARGFAVVPTAGVTMETLVPPGRVFQLGAIPPSGARVHSIVVPASLPPGYVINAQAQVVGTNGLARTNSTPIVVR